MLLLATDGYASTRTSYGGYASPSYGYAFTRLPMVDMLLIAMGMTDMMDMLLLATDMDMLLPATDRSTSLQILSSGIQGTHTLSSNRHTPWARI